MSSVTEIFDVGAGFPTLGSWTLNFRPGTEHVLGPSVAPSPPFYNGGIVHNLRRCHLFITAGKLGARPTHTAVKAAAIYGGSILDFNFGVEGEPWSLGGPSALVWLGDDDGVGPGIGSLHYRVGSEFTGTFADYLLAMVVGNYVNGIGLDATASGIDSSALGIPINGYDVARDRINKLCHATTPVTEYAFLPDLQCVFAPFEDTAGQVFTWDPTVILGDRKLPPGTENGLRGFPAEIRPSFSYRGEIQTSVWSSREWIEDGTGSFAGSSGSNAGRVNFDAAGNSEFSAAMKLVGTSLDTYFTVGRALTQHIRRDTMTVKIPDAPLLRAELKPGDHVWVEDEFHGVRDPDNTVRYGGKHRHPRRMRVSQLEYPVTRSMGAYIVKCIDGSNDVIPVHDLIEPGSGPVTVGVATTSPMTMRRQVKGTSHRSSWSDVQ